MPEWLVGRVQPLKNTSTTFIDYLSSENDARNHINVTASLLRDLSSRIPDDDEISLQPRECFGSDIVNSVRVLMVNYGLVPSAEHIEDCAKRVFFSSKQGNERKAVNELTAPSFENFDNLVLSAGKSIISEKKIGWEGGVFSKSSFKNIQNGRCTLSMVTFFKVENEWIRLVSFGNTTEGEVVSDWERASYHELLYLDEDSILKNRMFNISQCRNETQEDSVEAMAFLDRWKGKNSASSFITRDPEENNAISVAQRGSEKVIDDFNDIDSPAEITIFLLPLILAFVPVGLFTDISQTYALILAILTDILSAIPIALKSGDILRRSAEVREVMIGDFYGFQDGSETNGAAELFFASCTFDPKMKNTGVALLVITIFILLFSITLDIITFIFLSKQRVLYALKKGIEVYDAPSAGFFWFRNANKRNE